MSFFKNKKLKTVFLWVVLFCTVWILITFNYQLKGRSILDYDGRCYRSPCQNSANIEMIINHNLEFSFEYKCSFFEYVFKDVLCYLKDFKLHFFMTAIAVFILWVIKTMCYRLIKNINKG